MAKQERTKGQDRGGMGDVDRLRLRVSAMINSPKAQSLCRASIWRLDSDSDLAWNQVLEDLAETDGLEMSQEDDGTVTLKWEAAIGEDGEVEEADPEPVIQRLHEDRAPF